MMQKTETNIAERPAYNNNLELRMMLSDEQDNGVRLIRLQELEACSCLVKGIAPFMVGMITAQFFVTSNPKAALFSLTAGTLVSLVNIFQLARSGRSEVDKEKANPNERTEQIVNELSGRGYKLGS